MILIRQQGSGTWSSPTVTAYDNEHALKKIVLSSPHLIPGIGESPVVAVEEVTINPAGSADVIAVESNGTITIVECKLHTNTEIRRKVIGQALAYAATLWGYTYEQFDEAMSRKAGRPLSQRMNEITGELDESEFRRAVEDRLLRGEFRLVIAVDQITDELKRTVLYLNQHTHTTMEVLALELGYIADAGVEILVPATYGLEVSREKKVQAGETRQQWDEAAVFDALAAVTTPAGLALARRLYEYAQTRGATMRWGARMASLGMRMSVQQKQATVISLYAYPQRGVLAINIAFFNRPETKQTIARFAATLREVPVLAALMTRLEDVDYNWRDELRLDDLAADPNTLPTIVRALDQLLAAE